jgi:ATP/ADP translocase
MSDVANQRAVALETYMPELIFWLLVCVVLMSGVLAGHAMARRGRSWLHMVLFCAIISLTISVMFDFNYPRYGLIRVDAADNALLRLSDSMR